MNILHLASPLGTALRLRRLAFVMRRSSIAASVILILPAALVMGAVVLYPIFTTARLSLTDAPLISLTSPSFVGLANYADWLSNPDFWRSLLITLLYTGGVTIGAYLIGLGTALFSIRVSGRAVLRGLVLLPWAVQRSQL